MALCDEGDERKPAAEGRPLRVKEFVGGKNNGSPFCFRHRTALLRSLELLLDPGAQKRNAPSPSDMGRVTFMISHSLWDTRSDPPDICSVITEG